MKKNVSKKNAHKAQALCSAKSLHKGAHKPYAQPECTGLQKPSAQSKLSSISSPSSSPPLLHAFLLPPPPVPFFMPSSFLLPPTPCFPLVLPSCVPVCGQPGLAHKGAQSLAQSKSSGTHKALPQQLKV